MHNKSHILITGAASGLGRALALAYAQQAKAKQISIAICISDLDKEGGAQTVEQVNALLGNESAFFVECDICQQAQLDALVAKLTDAWGQLDILVNNAGVATAGSLASEDIAQWQWVLDINLLGLVRMTKACYPLLKQSSQTRANNQVSPSKIINIASQAGITPIPMMASYNAAKAAVVSFSETMHLELARDKIQVSVACPSFFETNLDKSLRSKQAGAAELVAKMLKRAKITAEDVARIIIERADAKQFMILSHPEGRMAYRLKRYLPTQRYLNMLIKKTKHFGVPREQK